MAEVSLLLLAALGSGVARAGVDTIVTFDNGEFNAPLFTPRWNGRWKQPSVAQEVATSLSRVLGENPRVYTYLPPGQGAARPGDVFAVSPSRPGCLGPSDAPGDACWCSPADNCWGALEPSWYRAASTSLFLTTSNLRKALKAEGDAPRIEIHVTDLFEEDPTAADDPADSDRCVTRAGVRRAVQALVAPVDGDRLDHLAVGLLQARIDPPPPGASWGRTYTLGPDAAGDGCHSGRKGRPWESGVAPMTMTMAVVILGFDTAAQHAAVSALLDGLVGQLDSGPLAFRLVRLREPPQVHTLSRVVRSTDTEPLKLPPAGPTPSVPCGAVTGSGTLTSGGRPVAVASVSGGCDGSYEVAFEPRALSRAFLAQAGLDPRRSSIALTGGLSLEGDPAALRDAYARVGALNGGERPLPLWGALEDGLALAEPPSPTRPWRAWSTRVEIGALGVTDLDQRPWLPAALAGLVSSVAVGAVAWVGARRLHATRALRKSWEASQGKDPLIQRPIAVVISEAQEEVDRSWPIRAALGIAAGGGALVWVAWLVMIGHRVLFG